MTIYTYIQAKMHSSTLLLTLLSVAGGALAGCTGESGCCCSEAGATELWRRGDFWVRPGTTQEQIDEWLANGVSLMYYISELRANEIGTVKFLFTRNRWDTVRLEKVLYRPM